MENEQIEATEATTSTPTTIEKRPRRKKGKIDEVLKSIHRIGDVLSDTGFHTRIAGEVVRELREIAGVSKSYLPKLVGLDRLGEFLGNLYGCAVNTNAFVAAIHK